MEVLMKKKFVILTFLLSSLVVLLPSRDFAAYAKSVAPAAVKENPQIRVEIGRRHDRRRHLGRYKKRRMTWYYYRRPGYTPASLLGPWTPVRTMGQVLVIT